MSVYFDHPDEGTDGWTEEIFTRAYCLDDGPFDRVRRRLELGFSVLVYLPGSCMDAAAVHIKNSVGGGAEDWREYGNHPGKDGSMEGLWEPTREIKEWLRVFRRGGSADRPDAIFKNLDRLFLDNNNGVIQHPMAQLAFFSLIESTRGARTLGLVDRDFGRLPESVSVAFAEHVWIDEIGIDRFRYLIPSELVEKLQGDASGVLDESFEWLLASRLRWSDPIRAVRIMKVVAGDPECKEGNIADVLNRIWEATRPPDFADPSEAFPGDERRITTGFPKRTLEPLKTSIINPYRAWSNPGDAGSGDAKKRLQKLPPGVILFGPPGTGKTYLASWIAKSIGLPIRVVSGAQLRVRDFGGTERNIVRMFREARRAAPCVIVLDDADDLLVDRAEISGSVAGAERAIVNTMLQELAGFGGRISGVLVIMTTNRFQHLDSAIRNRIPLHIPVPYPLDKDQVRSITESVASDFGYVLDDAILERLVSRFMAPVLETPNQRPLDDADRARVRRNLFSPREIQNAMRLLEGTGSSVGAYQPTEADLSRMEEYYSELARSPEIEDTL